MEIGYFEKLLKNNNAIPINEDWILFNDLELYQFKTDKSYSFNSFDELIEFDLGNEKLKDLIERTEDFTLTYSGGRGATSSTMGGGFNHARENGKDKSLRNIKFPAEFNVGGKNRSYEKTLALFKKKYANADHEYGVAVDEQGFVHRHIEGGKTSVAISGSKGQMVIHNHPSGGNFSDSDLISVSSTHEKGIVAVGSKKTYTFTKKKSFNAKGFIKAVKKAKWPSHYDYDTGADWWLKKNAKMYGYSYSVKKS